MNYKENMYFQKNDFSHWHGRRYHALDVFLKNQYGEKIYRVSLQSGLTCPNRDGHLHTRGCIFCSSKGSGDFAQSKEGSISQQLINGKKELNKKRNCQKFIAYFQSFTNTYGPIAYLRQIFMEAVSDPDVVILSIATRPDCLDQKIINLLAEINKIKPVWIELGLQTMHTVTHRFIRSGFTTADFESSIHALAAHHISVIVHVILGLPGETKEDMLSTIRYLSVQKIFGVKLQLLHVLKDTDLGTLYQREPFPLFDFEEYCNFIVDCLELFPKDIVIHRLTGDGPKDLLLAPLWSTKKLHVLNQINRLLKERDTYQGKLYKE